MSYFDNKKLKVAAIQMVSGSSLETNLNKAAHWIEQAAQAGAQLIALPEYFCFFGNTTEEKYELVETFGTGPIQDFLSNQALKNGVYLVGGTLALASEDPKCFYNSTLVYSPKGDCIGRYDKIHLFSFHRGSERFDEALTIKAGAVQPCVITTPDFRLGLGICYDLRFPELFRAMDKVDLIVLPSAFTYTTGLAHWEILLKARAIENQCYVLAPAQGGVHESGRRTWGHSMLVDPWGERIDCLATNEGYVSGIIDQEQLVAVRTDLPALTHRRFI